MKILLIHGTSWNDDVYGNNMLTTWFQDQCDLEFALIYMDSVLPKNNCCTRYFCITDRMIIDSYLKKIPAGKIVPFSNSKRSAQFSSHHKKTGELIRLLRNVAWRHARINTIELKQFIQDFDPDIIFSPRKASMMHLRIEKEVRKISSVPFVAFTGDNEIGKFGRFNVFFNINKILLCKMLKKNILFYEKYFFLSKRQAIEYAKRFNLKTDILYKTKNSIDQLGHYSNSTKQIKFLYAGKLYCKRDESLLKIGKIMRSIHTNINIVFDVYTQSAISNRKKRLFAKYKINIFPAINSDDLNIMMRNYDVLIHVESFSKKMRFETMYSISTKIVDYLSSGRCILVYAPSEIESFCYLKENDAAVCCSNKKELVSSLKSILNDRAIINNYAEASTRLFKVNHSNKIIKKRLEEVILDDKRQQKRDE